MLTLSLALSRVTYAAHDTHNQVVALAHRLRTNTETMVVKVSSVDQSDSGFDLQMLQFTNDLQLLREYGRNKEETFADLLIYPSILYDGYQADLDSIGADWGAFSESWEALNNTPAESAEHAAIQLRATGELAGLLSKVDQFSATLEILDDQQDTNQGQTQFFILVAGLVLLAAGIYVVIFRIIRPLTLLDEMVRVAAPGRQLLRIQDLPNDEIGRLANSFEKMHGEISVAHKRLEEKVDERTAILTTAFEFSQEIVSQPDQEKLIESIVHKARELMQTESVNLCLIHQSNEKLLQLVSAEGPHAQAVLPMTIGSIGDQGDVRSQIEQLCSTHQGDLPNNCYSTPLYDGERSLGALCVQCSQGRVFTEVERRTLTLLANSAAVAISNIRLAETSRRQLQLNATLTERQRLTSELHDEAAQTMNLLSLKVGGLDESMQQPEKNRLSLELNEIRNLIERAQAQMRMAFSGMSAAPSVRDDHVSRELRNFVDEFTATSGIAVDLTLDDLSALVLPAILHKQLMYIFREALTNVKRYANVKRVGVQLRYLNDAIHLEVNDEGRGFDPTLAKSDHHLGLSVMQARTERVGGILTIETAPGAGTRVIADIPIQAARTPSEVK